MVPRNRCCRYVRWFPPGIMVYHGGPLYRYGSGVRLSALTHPDDQAGGKLMVVRRREVLLYVGLHPRTLFPVCHSDMKSLLGLHACCGEKISRSCSSRLMSRFLHTAVPKGLSSGCFFLFFVWAGGGGEWRLWIFFRLRFFPRTPLSFFCAIPPIHSREKSAGIAPITGDHIK